MSSAYSIPIICGPTGSGKTGLAVQLAEQFPIEVVSADSRQIIKRLDIGTAKPTADERAVVRCHLIDLIEPGDDYSAYQFSRDAAAAVDEIRARHRIPVVVGGTGLYLKALTHGLAATPDSDPGIRARLAADMERHGPRIMWHRLNDIDPDAAARIHPNNRVRVIRALEIFELSGQTKSDLARRQAATDHGLAFEYFCLLPDRARLYARINARVDEMIAGGLSDEVRQLVGDGFGADLRAANVIGYNELLDQFEGRISMAAAVELIKRNHRRFAKRQYTWFRHQITGRYFPDLGGAESALCAYLEQVVTGGAETS